jgi:hypothetical protein
MKASSAVPIAFSAKATGQRLPSSRLAPSVKPKVAYRLLNLSAPWKKQTIFPFLPKFRTRVRSRLRRPVHVAKRKMFSICR